MNSRSDKNYWLFNIAKDMYRIFNICLRMNSLAAFDLVQTLGWITNIPCAEMV
jgi:hypothetical protein